MSEEPKDPAARTAHWGTCENESCLTSMVIYPHPDAKRDLPGTDEWMTSPFFTDCRVCGESMEWLGTDHPADVIIGYPRKQAGQ